MGNCKPGKAQNYRNNENMKKNASVTKHGATMSFAVTVTPYTSRPFLRYDAHTKAPLDTAQVRMSSLVFKALQSQ